ncbi:MAG: putative LPS assembly protein LptD [Crocinitomicaceae bacterium]
MLGLPACYSQELSDTMYVNDEDFDAPIYYNAEDSIYTDLRNEVVHLYGKAVVDNGEVRLDAGYIMIDFKSQEVLAKYRYDEDSNKVELPKFTDGSDDILAETVRYNFETKKAFIEEVAIQQDENFLYMGIAKRQSNEEVHFLKGRFTSCNLEEPHYHFQLSRAVMVPEKRIVSGPMNLWLGGVPTPIGLPFSIIPQMEDKTSGLMFPEIIMPSDAGFGLRDLGYYWPINDQFQTTFYGTIYSRGSWGVRNKTDYNVRYKFNGNLNVSFDQFRRGFPDTTATNKTTVIWSHIKDVKSSPFWTFRSNVNFQSDNNTQNSLDPNNQDYFNNTLSSDINMSRKFPGKPFLLGGKISLRQNSLTENISLASPVINGNMTRIFPFKNVVKSTGGLKGFRELARQFSVTYNFEGQNQALFEDTLLRDRNYAEIGNKFKNGISNDVRLATTSSLFKNILKITPSMNYANYLNFQQTSKSYDAGNDSIIVNLDQKFGMAQTMSVGASATTVLYSYYKFVGKNKPILRHLMTPSISYAWRPNLNPVDSFLVDTTWTRYSRFENSAYNIRSTQTQNIVSFGVNNTLQWKKKSEKDTVDGFKRVQLVDAFSIRSSYNIDADSFNLADFNFSLRTSPLDFINIVANANLSPYDWVDSTGTRFNDYAWKNRTGLQKFGRFTRFDVTTSLTLTSKKSRERLKNAVDNIGENWNADFNYYYLNPEQFLDFEIPWKATLSHVYTLTANQSITETNPDKFSQVQTLMFQGDVSFTKRWKLSTRTNFDLKEGKITNSRVSLNRDMHCWALSFDWTPIGLNQSFVFSLRSTSPFLQDIPINLRRPPTFL